MKKALLLALFHIALVCFKLNAQVVTPFVTSGLSVPGAIVCDASGNLFVASGSTIYKVTSSGVVSPYVNASVSTGGVPTALALDATGNLYIGLGDGKTIAKVNSGSSVMSTFATNFNVNPGDAFIGGMAFDGSGNLYAEIASNYIVKINSSGIITERRYLGVVNPYGVVFDAQGNYYISNAVNSRIEKTDVNGITTTFATLATYPGGLAFDPVGNLYAASAAGTIYKISPDGAVTSYVTNMASGHISFDSSGNIFATVNSSNTPGAIYKITNPAALGAYPVSLDFSTDVSSSITKTITLSATSLTAASASVNVTGAGLTISKDNTTFGTSTLTYTATELYAKPTPVVYVKFSPTAVGGNTGNIAISSIGATTQNVGITTSGVSQTTDANLLSLTINGGNSSPAFTAANLTYNSTVDATIATAVIIPTANNSSQTIQVNGVATSSGSPASVALPFGSTAIPVLVTAQDGITTKTYTINVTRNNFTAPAVAALTGFISFSNISATGATINWVDGSGSARAVFMRVSTGTSSTPSPANNTTYTANAGFGLGSMAATGWYCVYNGLGTSTSVTNLTSGTKYDVCIAEYNGTPGQEKYLSSGVVSFTPSAPQLNVSTTSVNFGPVAVGQNGIGGFTFSPVNVSSDVTFTTAPPFYVSVIDNPNFVTSATLSITSVSVPRQILLKYSPTTQTSSTGILTISAPGLPSQVITLNGTAAPTLIAPSPALVPFTTCSGTFSVPQSFALNGVSLPDPNHITVTAPAGFEVSTNANGPYSSSVTAQLTATIYVRLPITASGTVSGNIVLSSADAAFVNVPVSGVASTIPVGLTLGTVADVSATSTVFYIPYTGATGSPNQFFIAPGARALPGFTQPSSAFLSTSPITVAIPSNQLGTYDFNLYVRNSSTGCTSAVYPITLTVTGPGAPLVTTNAVTTFTSQTANFTGLVTSDQGAAVIEDGVVYGLSQNPTVTSATKLINTGAANAINVNATGLTPNSTYHVRAYATNSIGTSYGADVRLILPLKDKQVLAITSPVTATYGAIDYDPGATSTNSTIPIIYTSNNTAVATIVNNKVHIVGAGIANIIASQAANASFNAADNVAQVLTVNKALLNVTANNQSRAFGAVNPALTATYSGFVNGETAAVFTTAPLVSTTATTSSLPGSYPISVSGADAANYSFSYVAGTLTVTPLSISSLSAISLSSGTLSPGFAATTTSYTANAPYSTSSIKITPTSTNATETITVNGVVVNSGTASNDVSLSVGVNNINVKATAQDGVTATTYTITVTRALSNISTLASLTTNAGVLSPTFLSSTLSYVSLVGNLTTSISLIPTANDAGATIKINGTTVSSGSSSAPISLNVGSNTVNIVVTAPDGVSQQTYILIIERALIPTASLAANILSPNGDGKNDNWIIKDIELYPNNVVTVYDRAGRIVYTKKGYNNDWTGSLNGAPLAEDTYYYIVDLGNSLPKIKGFITILRPRK